MLKCERIDQETKKIRWTVETIELLSKKKMKRWGGEIVKKERIRMMTETL